jgi:tRNA (guanine-N7-)-methyltransferase
MYYFLRKLSEQKERKGRVQHFFDSEVIPALNLNRTLNFDLEIGCGHGHWLNHYSNLSSTNISVGIDLISKRIRKAKSKKDKQNNKNLFFLKSEASEFLQYKPTHLKISNIFIFFPDPWPKCKHHKRRLIQDSFLNLLHCNTHEQSKIFFRTDHLEYFDWVRLKIKENNFWKLTDTDFPFAHDSYFQQLLPNFSSIVATRV